MAHTPFHYLTPREYAYLHRLQRKALRYFIDNQVPSTGLVLDRQRNFGAFRVGGQVSTAATGMGLIALAVASADPHRLLSRSEACRRVRHALETAAELPQTAGVLPHFLDSSTGQVAGWDARSTIDTAWLLAGALWAAEFLGDDRARGQAEALFRRADWRAWTGPRGLIRHGARPDGRPLPCCWDRVNGETVFLYVLAAGADPERAWPAGGARELGHFPGRAGGHTFGSADLGLFVFQYGYDLLDLKRWSWPGGRDLMADATLAAEANAAVCRAAGPAFATYRRFWGLSAGDGPGEDPRADTYRCYSPGEPLDGTAHLTASLPSIAHCPSLVWENLSAAAEEGDRLCGRYGLAGVNLDRAWVASDMVGIDAGAVVLALENLLCDDRVREVFHRLPAVRAGLERLGCRETAPLAARAAG